MPRSGHVRSKMLRKTRKNIVRQTIDRSIRFEKKTFEESSANVL